MPIAPIYLRSLSNDIMPTCTTRQGHVNVILTYETFHKSRRPNYRLLVPFRRSFYLEQTLWHKLLVLFLCYNESQEDN